MILGTENGSVYDSSQPAQFSNITVSQSTNIMPGKKGSNGLTKESEEIDNGNEHQGMELSTKDNYHASTAANEDTDAGIGTSFVPE